MNADRSSGAALRFLDERRPVSSRLARLLVFFAALLTAIVAGYFTSISRLAHVVRAAESRAIYTAAHADAVSHATRYAVELRDEDYAAFRRDIEAIGHHRQAREHLRLETLDRAAARRELSRAGLQTDVVDAIVEFFARYGRNEEVKAALHVWRLADDEALSLEKVIGTLRDEHLAGRNPDGRRAAHAIANVNTNLIDLTGRYTDLATGAEHDIAEVLAFVMAVAAILILGIASAVTFMMWSRVRSTEELDRMRLALLVIAQESASTGELEQRILQLFCDAWGCTGVMWHRDDSSRVFKAGAVARAKASPVGVDEFIGARIPQQGVVLQSFDAGAVLIADRTSDDPALALGGGPHRAAVIAPIAFRGHVLLVAQLVCDTRRRGGSRRGLAKGASGWRELALLFGSALARLRAEEARAERDEFHRTITETIHDAIITIDAHQVITFANSSVRDVFGYAPEDLVGKPLSMLIPERSRAAHGDLVSTALREKPVERANPGERLALRADGREIVVDISWGEFARGGQRDVVVITRDITAKKKEEEESRAREQQLRVLLSQLPLALWSSNARLQIQSVAGTAFYPMLDGPLIGRPVHEIFFPPTDAEARRIEDAHRAALHGEKVAFELQWHNAVLQCFLEPVRDRGGEVASAVGVAFDITDRKATENALRESEERLRSLSAGLLRVQEDERRRISREIHDQLGQVLSALKLELGWLRNMSDAERTAERWQRATRLVDDTIQTVRSIARSLRPAVLDDFGLPTALRREFSEFAARTGIACTVTIEPDDLWIPDSVATAIFRISQEGMTNILRHANATAANLSLHREEGIIILEIEDNGRGMTRKALAELNKSVGIAGMTERAALLGGTATITSEVGRGTKIHVAIPVENGGSEEPR